MGQVVKMSFVVTCIEILTDETMYLVLLMMKHVNKMCIVLFLGHGVFQDVTV